MLKLNLRLFDDAEKTEEATPKKREDARKKGNVFQSREISSALTLFCAMIVLKIFGKNIFFTINESFVYFLRDLSSKRIFYSSIDGYKIILLIFFYVAKAIIIVLLINFFCAFLVTRAQVGHIFTTEVLMPKLDKINPIKGFKKLFSLKSVIEMLKSVLKLLILGYVGYAFIKDNLVYFFKVMELNKYQFSYSVYKFGIDIGIKLSLYLIVISMFDYMYQKYDYNKGLKMSKQEIKEEHKQMDGNPQIKSKIREKQRQMAMSRMMQDIPKADVVITNPTHFAIAIKYDEEKFDAPYVIAKGKNMVALKIKEKARESEIMIVENKPLARALYKSLEIGDFIPAEFYEAIAEILAYVYAQNQNN